MTEHTTLVCEHHRSADCLRFQGGEIDLQDGEPVHAELHYYCAQYPRLEGIYRIDKDVETVHGALVRVESRGTPLDEQRPVSGGEPDAQ
ncbi:hypothetical protein [Natrinema sp. DC36]|uniref:hypothetical protein n=1 Tax=Natrinema sp. DC36 TaxID=2878680 RepID=UPI001CF0A0E6|nr:hypothetical protein [Natrinema sp. DC36]